MTSPALNSDQSAALDLIKTWHAEPFTPGETFFMLEGRAGTGKTFLVRTFAESLRGRIVFTAPTNKATRVLRDSVTTKDYKPECRTIYSLLGLKLEANGEVKELSMPEDPLDLSEYSLVVVDEASMVSEKLRAHIHRTAQDFKVKFLFLGDRAQLPPVGETLSPVWRIKRRAQLDKIMRFDNQILQLSSHLYEQALRPLPQFQLASNFDETGGVEVVARSVMLKSIMDHADQGLFSQPGMSKAIAWRNVTVDSLNSLIRARIFTEPGQWLAEDRVLFTAPAKDLDDKLVATTDDEGKIQRVEEDWHPLHADMQIYRISIVLDTGPVVSALVLHPASNARYQERVSQLSEQARENRRLWGKFWEFKEAFHQLRHGYAITAHRAQGSTYDTAFVDHKDILLNRERQEAAKCLYVAATRPKTRLVLG
jgi:exodeoxyribonuclease-5